MPIWSIEGPGVLCLQDRLQRAKDLPQQMSDHMGYRRPSRSVRHELARIPEEGRRPRTHLGEQPLRYALLARRQRPITRSCGIPAVRSAHPSSPTYPQLRDGGTPGIPASAI